MALKTRPADLLAFREFAEARPNLLLCVDTSFSTKVMLRRPSNENSQALM